MALLEVRDVTLRFGGIVALDGVSFDVEEGQISGLIGPNGAGKTTAFNVITRLYRPDSGEVLLDGSSHPEAARPQDRAQGDRADVPEHPALPDDDSARERPRGGARTRATGWREAGARGAGRRRAPRSRAVPGGRAPVRHPEARRARPRARREAAAPSPRRAGRRPEPRGGLRARVRSSDRSGTTSTSPCCSSSTT